MDLLSREKTGKVERPVRVLQFGEGNFLRAFVDYMIDIANEQGRFNGDIVLVKPIEFGSLDRFHEQECQYTVQLRGIVDGEPKRINRIVTSVADAVDANWIHSVISYLIQQRQESCMTIPTAWR